MTLDRGLTTEVKGHICFTRTSYRFGTAFLFVKNRSFFREAAKALYESLQTGTPKAKEAALASTRAQAKGRFEARYRQDKQSRFEWLKWQA